MTKQPVSGTYPFGEQLHVLVQRDRTPKRAFVLGVYASAVHSRWVNPEGRLLVRALAVASEPSIFWDGSGADRIVEAIPIPPAAGRLEAAEDAFNGPSGRSLDANYLDPLRLTRREAWLCDLVPHTCLNPGQLAAITRAYEPRREMLGLPVVDLPGVPRRFADGVRRAEVLAEIEAANAEIVVLLGDQPIRHFISAFERRWSRLSDFGVGADAYGRMHEVTLGSRSRQVLPLAHPRQVGGLGEHSERWRKLHAQWERDVAPGLIG